jgi:hypothetical protein
MIAVIYTYDPSECFAPDAAILQPCITHISRLRSWYEDAVPCISATQGIFCFMMKVHLSYSRYKSGFDLRHTCVVPICAKYSDNTAYSYLKASIGFALADLTAR